MSEFYVRKAEIFDAADIVQIMHNGVKFWSGNVYHIVRTWFDANYTVEKISERIAKGEVYVAVDEEDVIGGTVMLSFENREGYSAGHMKGLYVEKKRSGVGSLLFDKVEELVQASDYDVLVCDVWNSNLASRKFVESKGFVAKKFTISPTSFAVYLLYVKTYPV